MREDPAPALSAAAPPAPGLHLLATPIGAARDITLRALDILAGADVLAAEDTRTLRRLMEIHGIALGGRPMLAYHDHNAAGVRPRLLAALAQDRSVAYASEAGTPLVADPGYGLARAAIAEGHRVWAAPGPSAVLAALTVSGLPSDRFLFAGFPPVPAGARRRWAEELKAVPATLIVYESPRRVHDLLGVLCEVWGGDRAAALCRELTKRFEEVRRGTLATLADDTAHDDLRGEVVLVVDRAAEAPPDAAQMEAMLTARLGDVSLKLAVAEVAEATGLPRREVYQAALRLAGRT
ncbi:16S rRNA (cytidine(1402)-2'-O)-methyltransferase [Rhodobaculum claviforme]|uniref:Ribosomal RNA small subunit methyltransferase I n=1 Tax=Rhodobaculum claviforme TaxID=1549854 RepID=A0A934TLD4_9RHOB|nr:16S rRNA (cytidine(1402)-2'-O)-methyltransferase [Rhodobaculum claviforme]MBK5927684.1 16S rRNA (cytidine(1402)-2'-O)-methyltransferase [Rhodobaculum claviforme]